MRCASRNLVLIAVVALGIQGCQDAARPLTPRPMMAVVTAEPAPLVPRIIPPEATDPAIDWIPPVNPNCTEPQCDHHHATR
jgi:hypothetical protein